MGGKKRATGANALQDAAIRLDGSRQPNAWGAHLRGVVTTVSVVDRLGPYATQWDELVDRSPQPSPFLRSWWLEAVAGPKTQFVLVLAQGRLAGGIAIDTDRRRGVARGRIPGMGPLAPHNLDLVALPGSECDVCAALLEHLNRHRLWIADFFGVRADSRLLSCGGPSTRVARFDGAPFIHVPGDFDLYLGSRGAKLRQEIRRIIRRLDESGYRHRVVERDETTRALSTFEALHRRRWGSGSGFLPAYRQFADAVVAGASRGEVVFQEILLEETVVASLVSLEVAGISSWYQMGRDPDSRHNNLGMLLKARAVERSCRLGHLRIDLCVGEGRLKTQWADEVAPVLRVRWASGRTGRLIFALSQTLGPKLARLRR